MEKLTILGGKGFIGSAYVRQFYDSAVANIYSINERDDYEVHSKDVLYFISTVHNYHIFTDPHLDIETNLTVLINVLENWRKRPDSKDGVFNFISSWFVYGNNENPVAEGAPCNPKGFYSITKRCAEQLLVSYCNTHCLKYRILRLANVVGRADTKTSAKKNALQYMVGQLGRNEPVHIYGTGDFYRDYIQVTDCVSAIDIVLSKGNTNEIYNVGNGKTWVFKDIIFYAKHKMTSRSSIEFVEPSVFHSTVQVHSFYMDNTKLRALGYAPDFTEEKLWDSILPAH